MRVVIDTNVVVSGIFFGGVPRAVLEACEDGRFELVVTPSILDEYSRTCDRLAKRHPTLRVGEILLHLVGSSVLVVDPTVPGSITRDPDDDKFMAAAHAAQACVVSGDEDLIDADGWMGVEVITPRTALDRLEAEHDDSSPKRPNEK